MSIEEMCKLTSVYKNLIIDIAREMTSEEGIIIQKPSLGSVVSGFKQAYAGELRKLLSELCGEYYFTVSIDRLSEYKSLLESRTEALQGSVVEKSTEEVARLWADKSVLTRVKSALREIEDFRVSNGIGSLTTYGLCKYLCAELALEGKTRLSVSGLYMVLFRFREIHLEYRFLFGDKTLRQGIDGVVRSDDLDNAFLQLSQLGYVGTSRGEMGIFMDCVRANSILNECDENVRKGIFALCRMIC